jgi:hypothetical protein
MRLSFNPFIKLAGLILACMSLQANGATLFADDFNDGNAAGWSVVKDGQGVPAWRVTSGSYHQNNEVSGATRSFLRGTYALYADGLDLTDYQLSAELTPTGH